MMQDIARASRVKSKVKEINELQKILDEVQITSPLQLIPSTFSHADV